MAVPLKLTIELDDKGAITKIKHLGEEVDKVGKESKKASDAGATGFGAMAKSIVAAVAASYAFNKSLAILQDVTKAAMEQERQEYRLAQALKNTGQYSEAAVEYLKAQATELQRNSTMGDETALSLQALAISMGATTKQAAQVARSAADLGVAMGMDAESAARNLAKTLSGMQGELSETVKGLKDLTKEELQAGAGIDLVAAQFSGMATDGVPAFELATAQLTNSWGDLKEEVGKIIIQNPELIQALQDVIVVVGGIGKVVTDNRESLDLLIKLGSVASPAWITLTLAAKGFKSVLGEAAGEGEKFLTWEQEQARQAQIQIELGEEVVVSLAEQLAAEKKLADQRAANAMGEVSGGAGMGIIDMGDETYSQFARNAADVLITKLAAEIRQRQEANPLIDFDTENLHILDAAALFAEAYGQSDEARYAAAYERYLNHNEAIRILEEEHKITEDDARIAQLEADRIYEEERTNIAQTGAAARAAADAWVTQQRVQATADIIGSLAELTKATAGQSQKQFKILKALEMARAVVSAGSIILGAMRDTQGDVYTRIAAGVVAGITAAVQIANISKAQPPAAAYETGTTDTGPRSGMALLHPHEAVIPRNLNPFLSGGGSGGGGGASVTIHAQGAFFDRKEAVREMQDMLTDSVMDALRMDPSRFPLN